MGRKGVKIRISNRKKAGEPHRARTCNRLIKSQLLYQLS